MWHFIHPSSSHPLQSVTTMWYLLDLSPPYPLSISDHNIASHSVFLLPILSQSVTTTWLLIHPFFSPSSLNQWPEWGISFTLLLPSFLNQWHFIHLFLPTLSQSVTTMWQLIHPSSSPFSLHLWPQCGISLIPPSLYSILISGIFPSSLSFFPNYQSAFNQLPMFKPFSSLSICIWEDHWRIQCWAWSLAMAAESAHIFRLSHVWGHHHCHG